MPDAVPIRGVSQFAAGQSNPTYLIEGPARRFVLRKIAAGHAAAVGPSGSSGIRILAALAETDVPVPRVQHLCEDLPTSSATAFYVMDRHPSIRIRPGLRLRRMAQRALRARWPTCMARLHSVDWRNDWASGAYGKEGNYIARQIRRWSGQYEASRTDEIPEMDRLLAWLPDHIPDGDETTIVHGDYRRAIWLHVKTSPASRAVLDVGAQHAGPPAERPRSQRLAFSIPRGTSALPGRRRRRSARRWGCREKRRTGTPTASRAEPGRIADWRFYMAFAFFRMAAICLGVYARGLKGNASAPNAHEYGDRARAPAASAVPAVLRSRRALRLLPCAPLPFSRDGSEGGERESTLAGVGASSVVPRNRVGRHQNSRVNPRMAPSVLVLVQGDVRPASFVGIAHVGLKAAKLYRAVQHPAAQPHHPVPSPHAEEGIVRTVPIAAGMRPRARR